MIIFIHHPLDIFPQLLNMSHYLEFTVTPQSNAHTTVLYHKYNFYIHIFCLTTSEVHSAGLSSSDDLNYHPEVDEY